MSSSLAFSEIGDKTNNNINMQQLTPYEKNRMARKNITYKKQHKPEHKSSNNNNKVNNMLKLINNTNGFEGFDGMDDTENLVDFTPPPHAEVNTLKPENDSVNNNTNEFVDDDNNYEIPSTIKKTHENVNNVEMNNKKDKEYPSPIEYEGFNKQPNNYSDDYNNQYIPYFNKNNHTQLTSNETQNKNMLLDKLNYMIHLLEEQKDEKTGHVMEEVVLYSFLGVFIIFIVDSFARAGKYSR